jgi:hypothetical protein
MYERVGWRRCTLFGTDLWWGLPWSWLTSVRPGSRRRLRCSAGVASARNLAWGRRAALRRRWPRQRTGTRRSHRPPASRPLVSLGLGPQPMGYEPPAQSATPRSWSQFDRRAHEPNVLGATDHGPHRSWSFALPAASGDVASAAYVGYVPCGCLRWCSWLVPEVGGRGPAWVALPGRSADHVLLAHFLGKELLGCLGWRSYRSA